MQVPVSDTVGCGDSFAAAIVLGYVKGYDVPATMALANAVGAATAMGTGAGTNVASAENVMRLLTTAAQADKQHLLQLQKSSSNGKVSSMSGNAAALQVLQDTLALTPEQ